MSPSFLRCFRDPIRVPRIENRVPRIRENYQGKYLNGYCNQVQVPTGPYRPPNIFLEKKPDESKSK